MRMWSLTGASSPAGRPRISQHSTGRWPRSSRGPNLGLGCRLIRLERLASARWPTALGISDGASVQANSLRHDRITRSALSTTCSVVKPYSRMTTLPGAEAPNLSTEITSPFGPAYRCQP